jgi:hypothetical protein
MGVSLIEQYPFVNFSGMRNQGREGGPQQTSMAVSRRKTSNAIFAWLSVPEGGTNITVSIAKGV